MKRFLVFLVLVLLILVSCEQKVHVHTWDEGSITVEPSCVSIGAKVYTCTACGETRTEVLQKTGHTAGEKTLAPTCLDPGYIDSVCTVCGQVLSHAEQGPTGHQWNEGTVIREADCTSIGLMEYHCLHCDETKTEVIGKTGHTPGEEMVIESTCTSCGYRETACSVCGLVYEHEILPLAPHSWDEGEVTRQATCTSIGTEEHTCTVCNETRIIVIPAKGHTEREPVVFEGTCTEDGYEKVYCTECGQEISCVIHEAPGHDFYAVEIVPATCVTTGSEYHICSNCNFAERIQIDSGDHTWDEGVVTTKPTCTKKGVMTYTCTNCGETKTEEIDMIEHDFQYDRTVSEPNCVDTGTDIHVCASCGLKKEVETPVDPDNHKFPVPTVVREAGYFLPGLQEYICDACGKATGETSETMTKSLTGYWRSEPVVENIEGVDTEVWYEINFDGLHLVVDFAVKPEGSDTILVKAGTIDTAFSVETDEDELPDGVIARIDPSMGYDSIEVVFETGSTFTLRLEGLDGVYDFTFSRISKTVHTHTLGPICEGFDKWMHKFESTCTEHDTYTILRPHVYDDEEYSYSACILCGSLNPYMVSFMDGENMYREYADPVNGIELPEIENGNYWLDYDSGNYFSPGDIYYLNENGENKLMSVTI